MNGGFCSSRDFHCVCTIVKSIYCFITLDSLVAPHTYPTVWLIVLAKSANTFLLAQRYQPIDNTEYYIHYAQRR